MLALDGSNWQRVDLFEFQIDIEVCLFTFTVTCKVTSIAIVVNVHVL